MGMGNRFGYVPLVMVFLLILIRLGYRYEWTGFGEATRTKDEQREIQPRKTLWDWMQLLFVPTMLALLAGGLTWWQTSSERARQAEEAASQEALRAQNTAVQVYLDQMTTLMLEQDLRGSDVDSEVRTIAQARTSAVLQAVESQNLRTLLQFLSDARLIQRVDGNRPIISLDRVDLSDSDLRNIALNGSNLSFAILSEADLRDATLSDATLSDAILQHADLGGADLREADLRGANLSYANLRFADLREADLREANLSYANLRGAKLSGADLKGANLRFADLRRANLSDTYLPFADLSDAYVGGADLSYANLSYANLSGVTGLTGKQIAATESLEGATMPDGQKYED
jgi:uncharacterized protein YjbI with pentapeptide repeats